VMIGATGFSATVGRGAAPMVAHKTATFRKPSLIRRPRRLASVTVPVQVTFTAPCKRRDEDIDPAAPLTRRSGMVFVSR